MTNSNSYLIIYLVIILVLLYAITFMSNYTCKISNTSEGFRQKYYNDENDEDNEEYEDDSKYYSNDIALYPYEDFNNIKENFESAQANWNTSYMATDFPGNDISSSSSKSVQDCGNQCIANPQCNAFVTNGSGTKCWLKSSLGQGNYDSDRNTYVLNRPSGLATGNNIGPAQLNTDYPGNDLEFSSVTSAQDCANKCAQNTQCNAFITDNAGNNCWLKSGLGQSNSNSDRISYILNKAQPGESAAFPLTINDFTLLGVGYANQLYIQDVIGGVFNPNSKAIENSQSVIDITVLPNGSLIGVGSDNQLYSRQTLNSTWVNFGLKERFKSVSVLNDGHTLACTGMDNTIFTLDANNINASRNAPQQVDNGHFILKMIQLQNGQFLAIGTDTKMYIGSGTFNPYTINWQQVSTNNCCAKSIAQAPNGNILILDTNGKVQITNSPGNPWTITNACCFSAIACMPIPPQNISGYSRKGAFVDDSNRTIPNFIGNYNTLPECIDAGQSKGYNTIGYQNMTQCFGGNNSPYDRNGFQTDNTKSVSAYPGVSTNIVYKTNNPVLSVMNPVEGEVFIFTECQFTGSSAKLKVGQYPQLDKSQTIKSAMIGPMTKMTIYSQQNFQGTSGVFYGNADAVNKDANCIDFTFNSVKIEKYPDALPINSSNLTNEQLVRMWTSVGCNANSSMINDPKAIANWKGGIYKTTAEVAADMKQWATDNDPTHKQGCYTPISTPNTPGEGEIVLFENCDFGGRYKKFGMGNVAFVGNDFNDITSSIKIGPYTSITIYENANFEGKNISFKNDTNSVSSISCLINNNFNDILSSLKVSSSTAQVNNNLDVRASPVFTLGPLYMSPWNLKNFVDKNAQWIWWNQWCGGPKGYAACTGSAPIDNKPVRFQLIVPNTGNRDIPAVVHVIADNAPQGANFVKLNGKLVGQIMDSGWATPNYTQVKIVLAPGNNLLEFDVQNTGGGAGLLVSVINTNTGSAVANSGSGQWGWVDPSKVISSILSEEVGSELVIHDESATGKVINFKNIKEIEQIGVGGTFRLKVTLKNVPPYIKGQQFKEGDINDFYVSVEKLDPNCQIDENNRCMNIYVDNKRCSNAVLSNISRVNAYRLVLISKVYVLDPTVPFGKNVDFTLVKVGERIYLKNIQTGYMPKLTTIDYKQDVYGFMDTDYLSNINSLKSNLNTLCGADATTPEETPASGTPFNLNIASTIQKAFDGLVGTTQPGPKPNQKFINCSVNADGNLYLLTTTNLTDSNTLRFVVNKDGSVSIRLQTYNMFGNVDKSYTLCFCNFNVNTYAYIEKLTNPIGTFLINMVCFDDDAKREMPNNTLNFNIEVSKYPDSYLENKNINNLNN